MTDQNAMQQQMAQAAMLRNLQAMGQPPGLQGPAVVDPRQQMMQDRMAMQAPAAPAAVANPQQAMQATQPQSILGQGDPRAAIGAMQPAPLNTSLRQDLMGSIGPASTPQIPSAGASTPSPAAGARGPSAPTVRRAPTGGPRRF